MKTLKTILISFSACIGFVACTDLDEELRGEFTERYTEVNPSSSYDFTDALPTSDDLSSAYGKLRDGSANHGGVFSLQTLPSDEAWIATKGGDWFDGGVLIDLHKHNFLANNGFITGTWNQQYGAINEINNLIDGGSIDNDGIKQLRLLRAFFHWRLLDIYGNVKIIESSDEDVNKAVTQSSRSEVFDFVESEILEVLGLTRAEVVAGDAPTSFGVPNDPYRVNEFAAMGLLSKLYLNAEVYTGTAMWDEAYAAANYVIENGTQYSLATASFSGDTGSARTMEYSVQNLGRLNPNEVQEEQGNIYTYDNLEGYAAIFAANNGDNPEFIWSIQYDETASTGMNFAMMTLHYGSQFTWNFTAQPWNGYATLQDFYNSYDDANDRRKESNHIAGVQKTFNGGIVRDYAKEPNDPDTALDYTPANEGGIFPNGLRQAGARMGKFSFKQFGRPDMANDYPIIRLGDLYLVRAEANARKMSDWSMALTDVNIIRARAGAGALSSIDAAGFLAERGREMFQESSRRTDQIRFGVYYAGEDSGKGSTVSPEYKNIMPIPLDAINAATTDGGQPLEQNTGY